MARRQKVEVTCDRCKRVYEVPESPDHSDDNQSRGVFIDASELGLGQVSFDDLCPACGKRVSDLVRLILKVKTDTPATSDGETQAAPTPATAEEGEQQSTDRPDTEDGLNPQTEERQ